MRMFNRYTYIVGHVDFGELPGLVDRFLLEQNLEYEQFCYDLRDIENEHNYRVSLAQEKRIIPRRKSAVVYGLTDMAKEFPWLHVGSNPEFMRPYYASNMDAIGQPIADGVEEQDIRELLKHMPTPYYIDSALFSYCNVNFFDRKTEPISSVCESNYFVRKDRLGCHITFVKEYMFTSMAPRLYLTVETTDGDAVLDATPYAKAMSEILGKKYTCETVLHLTDAEKAEIDGRNETVKPLLDAATEACIKENYRYGERVPYNQREIQFYNFTVAKTLKKLGKQFGFTEYRYINLGIHLVSKRVAGGHLLTLVVDTPQYFNEMRPSISLDGFGFSHQISLGEKYVSLYGESQDHADSLMRTFFEIIRDLEEDYLKPIFAHYPDTPAWYEIEVK